MLAALACVGLLLVPVVLPRQPVRDPLSPSFATTLATYGDGDLWAAMAALATIRDTDLGDVMEALWKRGGLPQPVWAGRIRTAIALLTEAWLVRDQKGQSTQRDPYLLSARSMVRTLVRVANAGREGFGEDDRRFARDWYLLVVAYRHGAAQIGWSRMLLAEARDLFPNDAGVLEVSGADHEMVSAR